jgi:DnaJ domain
MVKSPTSHKTRRYHAPQGSGHACDVPGCTAAGEYRAPKNRQNLYEYYWFCLEHVRFYNQSWDYFRGMNPLQIEQEIRSATVWNRPSWRLGEQGVPPGKTHTSPLNGMEDLGIFNPQDDLTSAKRARASQPSPFSPADQRRERQALAVLAITHPTDFQTIKTRYKELAKQHHPDANGGDKHAEERLKIINDAYSTLKSLYQNL